MIFEEGAAPDPLVVQVFLDHLRQDAAPLLRCWPDVRLFVQPGTKKPPISQEISGFCRSGP
ncbi:hypothetical protein BJF93_06785 [Xaviernesmea oryzae]|uniref:Uncharacterized protein n=1 Tax=Xaviernesmea oryzae TaxID=464029 RepID=A0A1Q9ASF6_9HYPH|nr:hypothetical protein BJF93_06785 [Xaviernesmea oryzae]